MSSVIIYNQLMKILAIETSCDETAAAIVEHDGQKLNVLSNVVASQMKTHAASGGVIPDVAARMHTENLPAVLAEATNNGQLTYDAVAVTTGPGLVGCLLIGLAAAKSIVLAKNIPFFAINHLEGHIYSVLLENEVEFPVLVLIVSGGHTEMILMKKHLNYQLLGATRDDAAGEAFDKVARLLELGYPGGPAISQIAEAGDRDAFSLPIGLEEKANLEFSFSGLKAAVATKVKDWPQPMAQHLKADLAASFEKTVAETISRKTLAALAKYPEIKTVALVGGVAANKYLRTHLEQALNLAHAGLKFIVPGIDYCTDNAAMIGAAACYRHLFGQSDSWYDVQADPNLQL